MIPLNKSYKNRKVYLSIHCKYKYLDSTVQRAEGRRQKFAVCRLPFAVCRLPFAVNVKLNLSIDMSARVATMRETAQNKLSQDEEERNCHAEYYVFD